jgi:hypothetical protein
VLAFADCIISDCLIRQRHCWRAHLVLSHLSQDLIITRESSRCRMLQVAFRLHSVDVREHNLCMLWAPLPLPLPAPAKCWLPEQAHISRARACATSAWPAMRSARTAQLRYGPLSATRTAATARWGPSALLRVWSIDCVGVAAVCAARSGPSSATCTAETARWGCQGFLGLLKGTAWRDPVGVRCMSFQ